MGGIRLSINCISIRNRSSFSINIIYCFRLNLIRFYIFEPLAKSIINRILTDSNQYTASEKQITDINGYFPDSSY